MRVGGLLLAFLSCAAAAIQARQEVSVGEHQRFVATTDLVLVDVAVRDKAGQFISDLATDDFIVTEDGTVQAVEYLNQIELSTAASTTESSLHHVAPDVARNLLVSERRLIVVLIDDAMIPFDVQMLTSAKDIAREVVHRLGPSDLGAVVFTRDNRSAQDFTTDRRILLSAIDGLTSAGYVPEPGAEKKPASIPHYVAATEVLFRTVESLSQIHERRKAVILISTGIPLLTDTPDVTKTEHPYLNWVQRQTLMIANRGGVNIYAVDPGGLDGLRSYMKRRNTRTENFIVEQIEELPVIHHEFLKAVAENTGGRAFLNTNDFTSRIDQIFRDTGSFYLLGYRSTNPRADGRFRRLQVRVMRSGVTVSARRGYYAPPPPELAARMGAPPKTDTALAGLVPKTDLPLELAMLPIAPPGGGDAAVILTVGLRAPAARRDTPMAADAVDLLLRAFTPEGGDRGSTRLAVKVSADQTLSGETGYEVLGRLDLRPGRYELRASAGSAAWAESGSVYGYLDVPDFAREAVSLSGVAIGVTPARVAGNTAVAVDLLPFAPTTQRTFTRRDRVTAFVRVYQGGSGPPASVALAVRVVDTHDRVVADAPATLAADRFGAARNQDFVYELPIDRLELGPHLLTIEASLGRQTARRDVRFDVR